MSNPIKILKYHLSKLDDNAIENIAELIESESWLANEETLTEEQRDDFKRSIKYALEAVKEL